MPTTVRLHDTMVGRYHRHRRFRTVRRVRYPHGRRLVTVRRVYN